VRLDARCTHVYSGGAKSVALCIERIKIPLSRLVHLRTQLLIAMGDLTAAWIGRGTVHHPFKTLLRLIWLSQVTSKG